jgi:MFS transporter, DHA2 family, multidrug resistance protein
LSGRVDPRRLVAGGLLGTAASLYALSLLNLGSSSGAVFWPLFIEGVSLPFIFVPLSTATFAPIRTDDMESASGTFNLMRNIGGGLGIASAAAILFRRQQLYSGMLGARASINNHQAVAGLASAAADRLQPRLPLHQSYSTLWATVQRQAGMWAFRDAFVGLAILLVLIVPLLFLMKQPTRVEPTKAAEQTGTDPGETGAALLAT